MKHLLPSVSALLAGFLPGAVLAGTYADAFDTGIQPSHWTVHAGPTSTIEARNGEVVVTLGTDAGAYLAFNFPLSGDFDARADYRLITWPPNNQTRIGISLPQPGGLAAFGAVERISDGGFVPENEGYVTHFLDGITAVARNDSSGTLRLARTGTTLTGYFRDGNDWVAIASSTNPQYTALSPVYLPVWWEGAPAAGTAVAFDNFVLDAPGTNIPAIPEPHAWLLLGAGLAGLAALRRLRA